MTLSFIEAQREWTRLLSEFIAKNYTKRKVAERVQIFLTVPKGTEQEFKDLAKARREEADSTLDSGSDHLALSLKFEEANPPPRRSDYE